MKTNDKLIRAGDLFTAVCNDISIRGSAFAAIRRHIDAAPAVEAKEVVHGRWMYDSYDSHQYCSRCRKDPDNRGRETPYCSNCGAKMDGDRNGK